MKTDLKDEHKKMTAYSINEERGAKKADELRRRFRKVSNASRSTGWFKTTSTRIGVPAEAKSKHLTHFLVWVIIASFLLSVGVSVF